MEPMLAVDDSNNDITVIDYDINAYPFREWFLSVLDVNDLELLHQSKGVTL
jgi:hypothetical protein